MDYLFGKGVSRALPKEGLRLVRSRKSGRVKLVFQGERLIATVKPNGAFALTLYGASVLAKSPNFGENIVVVKDEAAEFVRGGKSVFCKFVKTAGNNVLPKGEAVIADGRGRILGVGTAVINGAYMASFKSGVAVKVRDGANR